MAAANRSANTRPSQGSPKPTTENTDAAPQDSKATKKNKKDGKRAKKAKPATPTVHLLRTLPDRRPDLLDRALETERVKEHAMAGAMLLQHAQVRTVEVERDAAFQRAHIIMQANENLERQLVLADRDVQDVVTSLKTGVQQKEQLRLAVEADVRKVESNKQRVLKDIDESYAQIIRKLKLKMLEKNSTLRQMNRDFHLIEEHHRHRHHVQEMLENIRQTIFKREKRHREVLNDIERRFLQEREVLQTEACKRLAMFGEKSYEEAVKNIDVQTRQVFAENNTQAAELELCLSRTKKLSERVVMLNNAVEQVAQQQAIEAETMHAMSRMEHQHTQKQAELEQQTIALRKQLQTAIDQLHERYSQLQLHYSKHIQQRDEQINVLTAAVTKQTSECSQLRKRRRTLDTRRGQVECFLLDVMTEAEQHARDEAAAADDRKNKHYVEKTLIPSRQQTSNFTTQHFPTQKHSAQADSRNLQYIDQPLPDGPTAAARDLAGVVLRSAVGTAADKSSSSPATDFTNNKTDFSRLSWHEKALLLRSLYLYATQSAVKRTKQRKVCTEQAKSQHAAGFPAADVTTSSTKNNSTNSNQAEKQLSIENPTPTTASAATSPPLLLPPKPLPASTFLSESDAAIFARVEENIRTANAAIPTDASEINQNNGTSNDFDMNDAKVKLDLLLRRVEEA